jgi:hypothetical protein
MGSIIRTAANNVGASGVFSSSAFNNASLNSVTSLPTAVDGKMKLILSQTASSDASLSFTSGIDSTYKTYCFKFINMHPSIDSRIFSFQGSTNGGSSYGVTTTSTYFEAYHKEDDSSSGLAYNGSYDLAQSTNEISLSHSIDATNADSSCSGELWLFNPSSTTYVKHFMSRVTRAGNLDLQGDNYSGGYMNTTSAINAIRFGFSASGSLNGNIDDGTIALYGIA